MLQVIQNCANLSPYINILKGKLQRVSIGEAFLLAEYIFEYISFIEDFKDKYI